MSDMPKEIWAPDVTEGSNNVLCEIEKRHNYFHTQYIRKDLFEGAYKAGYDASMVFKDPDTIIISRKELDGMRKERVDPVLYGLASCKEAQGWNALIDKLLERE
jgi:hypothetical protein